MRNGLVRAILCASCVLVLLGASGCSLFGSRISARETRYYTVARGDTLWDIGQRFGVSVQSLRRLNRIDDPRSLRIGQRLFIAGRVPAQMAAYNPPAYNNRPSQKVDTRGGRLGWPVERGRLVSRFGPRSGSFHDGLDLAAPSGTPVYAAHDGIIIYSGSKLSGYGNLVILKGSDGLTTVYAHNRRLLVSEGDRVRRGRKIAEVGASGKASGPHLHFEVRARDSRRRYVAVDPLPLLTPSAGAKPRYRVNDSLAAIMARLY